MTATNLSLSACLMGVQADEADAQKALAFIQPDVSLLLILRNLLML